MYSLVTPLKAGAKAVSTGIYRIETVAGNTLIESTTSVVVYDGKNVGFVYKLGEAGYEGVSFGDALRAYGATEAEAYNRLIARIEARKARSGGA